MSEPIEMWRSTDKQTGLEAVCRYLPETRIFEVKVGGKTGTFLAEFEPRFGMDATDMNIAYSIAGDLADEIAREAAAEPTSNEQA